MCQGLLLKAPVCLPALSGQRRSRALQSTQTLDFVTVARRS